MTNLRRQQHLRQNPRGEVPSVKVFEDDTVLVMMDIFPQSRDTRWIRRPRHGTCSMRMRTPWRRRRHICPGSRWAVKAATGADGIRLAQFNEAPAGQTVFHLHFHLIPVYDGVELGRHGGGKADEAELRDIATAIAAALRHNFLLKKAAYLSAACGNLGWAQKVTHAGSGGADAPTSPREMRTAHRGGGPRLRQGRPVSG